MSQYPIKGSGGEEEVGELVRGREESFFGYRAVEHGKRLSWLLWGAAWLFFLIGFIGMSRVPWSDLPMRLAVFACALTVTGTLFYWANILFEGAFNTDKRLLVEIERIGPSRCPLGRKWREQWRAGQRNRQYRQALIVETTAPVAFVSGVACMFF